MSQQCIDPIVGKILAGWRYDISGLAAEMRGDYENHFAACERCRSRQRIHRFIDVGLIALASVSGFIFLLAFGVIRHFGPRHAFWLEIAALAGFALSALIWLVVAVAGHSAGCGPRRGSPNARSPAGRDSRTPAGRAASKNHGDVAARP
jgi:hypothetical protein